MNLMEEKFFTAPRTLASLISVLTAIGSLWLFGELIEGYLEGVDTLGGIYFMLLIGQAMYIIFITVFGLTRLVLGRYYLKEELGDSIGYACIEFFLWIALAAGVLFLFSYLENISKVNDAPPSIAP
jgi:hypothetical protein